MFSEQILTVKMLQKIVPQKGQEGINCNAATQPSSFLHMGWKTRFSSISLIKKHQEFTKDRI